MRLVAFLLIVTFTLILSGCSIFHTHDERRYLNSIYENDGAARIPLAQFDSAWSRAKWFITTYASLPMKEINDSLIETKMPGWFEEGAGYKVTARRSKDEILIRAHCIVQPLLISFPWLRDITMDRFLPIIPRPALCPSQNSL